MKPTRITLFLIMFLFFSNFSIAQRKIDLANVAKNLIADSGMTTWPARGLIATIGSKSIVNIWNGRSGEHLHLIENNIWLRPVSLFRFIPKKNLLLLMSRNGVIWAWDVDTGNKVLDINFPEVIVFRSDVSSDGKKLLVSPIKGGASFGIYDFENNLQFITQFPMIRLITDRGRIVPNKDQILIASGSGVSAIYDIDSGVKRADYSFPNGLTSMAFSADGRVIATGTSSGEVDIWDMYSGKKLLSLIGGQSRFDKKSAFVNVLSFSNRGYLAAGRGDEAMVWDIKLGKRLGSWNGFGYVSGVGFVDDGGLLAISGKKVIKIVKIQEIKSLAMDLDALISEIEQGDLLTRAALEEARTLVSAMSSLDDLWFDQAGDRYMSPLMAASGLDRWEFVRLLLDSGADPNRTSPYGSSALTYASIGGYYGIVDLLIARGANLNTATKGGMTPLLLSVVGEHRAVAELIIALGGNTDLAPRERSALNSLLVRPYKNDLLTLHGTLAERSSQFVFILSDGEAHRFDIQSQTSVREENGRRIAPMELRPGGAVSVSYRGQQVLAVVGERR